MKKSILCVFMAMLMLFMCGCGKSDLKDADSSKSDPNEKFYGTWIATYLEKDGVMYEIQKVNGLFWGVKDGQFPDHITDEVIKEGRIPELISFLVERIIIDESKAKGTITTEFGTDEYEWKWSADGNDITIGETDYKLVNDQLTCELSTGITYYEKKTSNEDNNGSETIDDENRVEFDYTVPYDNVNFNVPLIAEIDVKSSEIDWEWDSGRIVLIYGTPIYESVHGDTAIAMAETAFEKVEKTYIGSEPALYGEGMKSIDHEDEYQYFLNFSTDSHYVLLGLMTIGPEEAAKKEFERFKETIVFD